jgi:stage II sporulation protein P
MLYRHRYKAAGAYRTAVLFSLVFLLFLMLYFMRLPYIVSETRHETGLFLIDAAVGWSERDPVGLIRSAAPVMAWAGNEEDPEDITAKSIVASILAFFRLSLASPSDLLASGMPALAEFNREYVKSVSAGTAVIPTGQKLPGTMEITPDALIGIYYTHTGETYALTDGVERVAGEKGGVVEVGKAIKERLEKDYGIRVAHYDRVNDGNYSMSYLESEKTARLLLEENKEVQILLDIHRDAGKPRSESVVSINGVEMAPVLLVIGSDARLPFPTWRNNYNFSVKLSERINEKYPGLCVGVRIKEGRYNQFLHPRALLVEVGSVSNSTEEAVQSANLLAGVLAEELMEIAPEKLGKAGLR